MNEGPCANYVDRSWNDPKRHKFIGFSAVDPGWHLILETLDRVLLNIRHNARANAGLAEDNKYKDPENFPDADIRILQIKEKFGTLRVYWEAKGMSKRFKDEIFGAVSMAETLSSVLCEKCGSREGVETRVPKGRKFGRVLTLCQGHHAERERVDYGMPG